MKNFPAASILFLLADSESEVLMTNLGDNQQDL